MSTYFKLLVVLAWVYLTWLVPSEQREGPQDIKDGHEQPSQSRDAVQDFMKKLRAARETNKTLYKRQHCNELSWYQLFEIWLEKEFHGFIEFVRYTFATHPKQSEKTYWDTIRRVMLTFDYFIYFKFLYIIILIVLHIWIARLRKIGAIKLGETEETRDRPAANAAAIAAREGGIAGRVVNPDDRVDIR